MNDEIGGPGRSLSRAQRGGGGNEDDDRGEADAHLVLPDETGGPGAKA